MLQKDGVETLPFQLNEVIVADIQGGVWQAGDRLPGERALADRFGVSRGTVIGALKTLEDRGYVERVPSKGAFVTADARMLARLTRIVMPYPERDISTSALDLEGWGTTSEYFHGLNEAAGRCRAVAAFRPFSEADERQLRNGRRLTWLDDADAVVFVGQQLPHLRARADDTGKQVVILDTDLADIVRDYPSVSYSTAGALETIADFLVTRGYRDVAVLSTPGGHGQVKKQLFVAAALQRGLQFNARASLDLPLDEEAAGHVLADALPDKTCLPEVYFLAASMSASAALYRVAWERNWRIGADVGAIGLASKVAFRRMVPRVTYYEIPHREMGCVACRMAVELVTEGQCNHGRTVVDGGIVTGDSTR